MNITKATNLCYRVLRLVHVFTSKESEKFRSRGFVDWLKRLNVPLVGEPILVAFPHFYEESAFKKGWEEL